VDGHVCACLGQSYGYAFANAARGASDERVLTLQVELVEDQGGGPFRLCVGCAQARPAIELRRDRREAAAL